MGKTRRTNDTIALIHFLAVVFLVSEVSMAKVVRPSKGKIRPVGKDESDPDFWREYAQNDIKRRLAQTAHLNLNVAKNVILFVGDGMGIQSVTMSRIYKGQLKGNSGEEEQLIWESFPAVGLSKTYNTDYQVADSAGTATAILSGVKTRLGLIGVDSSVPRNTCDPDVFEKAKLKNMLHWALDAGKEAGLVTTTRVTHATPASMYSHSADRDWEADTASGLTGRPHCNEDIAKQLIHGEAGSQLKVIFGGGRRNFLPVDQGGKRNDANLVDNFRQLKSDEGKSYRYLSTADDLRKWTADGMTDHVLGLFSSSHMKYMTDHAEVGDEEEPSLSTMVDAALKRLKSADNGFFLLVESGRIDHAHHQNYAMRAMEETIEFDQAVETALKHVDTDETLIIVTADHSHSVTINGYPKRGNNILGSSFGDPHSMSQYPNGAKLGYATISYANGNGYFDHFTEDASVPWLDFRHLEEKARIDPGFRFPAMMPGPEAYETHGGEDVPIYAIGPMAHLLGGVHEQNFIAHAMAFSSCIGDYADDCARPVATNGVALTDAYSSVLVMTSTLCSVLTLATSR